MFKKSKIEVNENLSSIFNYINDYEKVIDYKDLLQYCIDYGLYKEFYLNYPIINRLIEFHDSQVLSGSWVKPV